MLTLPVVKHCCSPLICSKGSVNDVLRDPVVDDVPGAGKDYCKWPIQQVIELTYGIGVALF